MIYSPILILALVALAFVMTEYGHRGHKTRHSIADLLSLLCAFTAFIGSIFYLVLGYEWVAAGHKVELINREYRTNYTQAEVFYASDVIDIIRDIKRHRVEVNGDLGREYEDARGD